jgi:tetratricopeptide (TPR) repeat protein
MQNEEKTIKVFISYGHDSELHKKRVLEFSEHLRQKDFNCWVDQYEIVPVQGWQIWMEQQIKKTDFVLTVCNERYGKIFSGEIEEGKGVSREATFISAEIYNNFGKNEKFIPITFSDEDREHVPTILSTGNIYNVYQPEEFQKLVNHLNDFNPTSASKLPEKPKPFTVPYHRNEYFTGRESLIKQVEDYLKPGEKAALTQPQKQTISGLGGIGKTQIAVEYAYRHKDSYESILWIDAENEASLAKSVAEIADAIDLPGKKSQEQEIVYSSFKNWMKREKNWLLILDNVDDMKFFSEFVPTGFLGSVLITTRRSTTGQAHELHVEEMADEGILLLLRRAGFINEKEEVEKASEEALLSAKEINKEFDGLPLALEQAGAYIKETGISLQEFLELFKSYGKDFLMEKPETQDYPKSVAQVFAMSLEKTEKESPEARELIQLCAFLDADSIPETIFKEGREHLSQNLMEATENQFKWNALIAKSSRFSLINRNQNEKSLRIHRLAQQVFRDDLGDPKPWAEKAIKALSVAFPDAEKFENWGFCRKLLPSVKAITDLASEYCLVIPELGQICNQAGYYLMEIGVYEESRKFLEKARQTYETCFEEEHAELARSLNYLGALDNCEGKYEQSEALLKRSLQIRKKMYNQNHVDKARGLNDLAVLYGNQGRYTQAEPLLKEALQMRKNILGEEHSDVANSLNNLAGIYRYLGRYTQAESLYNDALQMRKKLMGEKHPKVAILLRGLGGLFSKQGNYDQAELLYKEAFKMDKDLLGEEHPNVAMSLNGLAVSYSYQKRYEEVKPLYLDVLKMRKKLLGEEHPEVASTSLSLGNVYLVTKDYLNASENFEIALKIYEKTFGKQHINTIRARKQFKQVKKKVKNLKRKH